jgi:hypothetical protein
MKTFFEYLQAIDESLFNRVLGRLGDGSPVPPGWTPAQKDIYWAAFNRVKGTPGIGPEQAHADALATVDAEKKMSGWRAAAASSTPTAMSYKNPRNRGAGTAFDGDMPGKDVTPQLGQ